MIAWLLGETPCDFDINFSGIMTESSKTDYDAFQYTVYSAGPIKHYQFKITISPADGSDPVEYYEISPGGTTNVSVEREDGSVSISCMAFYDINETVYGAGDEVISSTDHVDQSSLLSSIVLFAYPLTINW